MLKELVDDLVSDAAQSTCRISLACCEHIGLFAEKKPNYRSKTRKPEPQLVFVQGNGMRKLWYIIIPGELYLQNDTIGKEYGLIVTRV